MVSEHGSSQETNHGAEEEEKTHLERTKLEAQSDWSLLQWPALRGEDKGRAYQLMYSYGVLHIVLRTLMY